MSKKILVSVLAIMTLAFTGCGVSKTTGTSNNAVASPEAGAEQTVTVVHPLGETEVPKNPKNIVVLELGILDGLDALGVEVKGLPLSGSLPDYLSAYEDQNTYTNVGSLKEINLEKIYEIEPELIIIGGRQVDYYEELSRIAPTVQLDVDASDYMNSFKTNMTYLGEIFNKEKEVSNKIAEIETAIAEIGKKAKEKEVNGLITLTNGDGFSVYGLGSRFGIIHNEFGIKPVDETIASSTHGQNASFEYIVEQNPDYLFVIDRLAATGGEGASAREMFENKLIKQIDAYKNNHIIYLDAAIWYTSGGGFTSTQIMIDEVTTALEK